VLTAIAGAGHEQSYDAPPRAESYQQRGGGGSSLAFTKITTLVSSFSFLPGFSDYMRNQEQIRRMMNDPLGTIFRGMGGFGIDEEVLNPFTVPLQTTPHFVFRDQQYWISQPNSIL